jgi:hypothetical protein
MKIDTLVIWIYPAALWLAFLMTFTAPIEPNFSRLMSLLIWGGLAVFTTIRAVMTGKQVAN